MGAGALMGTQPEAMRTADHGEHYAYRVRMGPPGGIP